MDRFGKYLNPLFKYHFGVFKYHFRVFKPGCRVFKYDFGVFKYGIIFLISYIITTVPNIIILNIKSITIYIRNIYTKNYRTVKGVGCRIV